MSFLPDDRVLRRPQVRLQDDRKPMAVGQLPGGWDHFAATGLTSIKPRQRPFKDARHRW
ncbi:hypothetical protein ACLM5J_02060 [Nocardioides sp. Bht2]|uniref:hypothetical protein n=1 Tax=Nocardioides sp. Bht2 TaxID=3392297 RepID=UPI0039B6A579